jgi:hypothetical protein
VKADTYTVQEAAAQQAGQSISQQQEQQNQQREHAARHGNIQELQNAYQSLLQQEEELRVQRVEIGQIKNAQENAERKWRMRAWGQNEPQAYQYQTNAAEANLPLLEGRLQNVRQEKQRVREELARAQRGR